MATRVDVITVRGTFGPDDTAPLADRIATLLTAGARWVAVDVTAADPVDGAALAAAARRPGIVVCGGSDALLRELTDAGVVATRRLLDVRVAARARRGDGLKRRFELLELPRL